MRILFELQHLYYLAQFESVICKLRDYYNHDLFISLNLSVPKIEKDLFYKEIRRLKIESIKANFEPQRRRILKRQDWNEDRYEKTLKEQIISQLYATWVI